MQEVFIISPYLLLLFSIMAGIISSHKISIIFFLSAIITALIFHRISSTALLSITILGTSIYCYYNSKSNNLPLKLVLFLLISSITILIFLHKIPGYNNLPILNKIKLNENSAPFSIWLNFDKPMIVIFLLLLSPLTITLCLQDYKKIFKEGWMFFLVLPLLLIIAGIIANYVKFDFKIPAVTGLWTINMLFFTCLSEELFFRYFLQNNLENFFQKFKYKHSISLIVTSIAFVFIHDLRSSNYIALVFITSIFYGLIYKKTDRIESAILLHFLVNLIHFLFLSYPYYAAPLA